MRNPIFLLIAALAVSGCAAAKPLSPFMQERNIFSPVQEAGQKNPDKKTDDKTTEVLAKLSVFMNTDSYRTPQRILLEPSVYEEVLATIPQETDAYDADTIHFARGVSLFRLHRYAEAIDELYGVNTESPLREKAMAYLETARKFAAIPRTELKPASSQEDLEALLSDLHAERTMWIALANDEQRETFTRSSAFEEIESVDRKIFGLIAEYQPHRAEEALGYLVTGHHASKNYLRYKLAAVYLLLWKSEYLSAQHSEKNKAMLAQIDNTIETTLKEIINEDGTAEKLEAKRLYEILRIRQKTAE